MYYVNLSFRYSLLRRRYPASVNLRTSRCHRSRKKILFSPALPSALRRFSETHPFPFPCPPLLGTNPHDYCILSFLSFVGIIFVSEEVRNRLPAFFRHYIRPSKRKGDSPLCKAAAKYSFMLKLLPAHLSIQSQYPVIDSASLVSLLHAQLATLSDAIANRRLLSVDSKQNS